MGTCSLLAPPTMRTQSDESSEWWDATRWQGSAVEDTLILAGLGLWPLPAAASHTNWQKEKSNGKVGASFDLFKHVVGGCAGGGREQTCKVLR